MYGFGASHRYDTKFEDDNQAMDVFLKTLHETIVAVNDKPYYIAGHSMGGFLLCHYLAKYAPENVKGVMLLSPAGTTQMLPNQMEEFYKEKNFGFVKKGVFNFALNKINNSKWNPLSFAFFLPNSFMFKRFFGSERLR